MTRPDLFRLSGTLPHDPAITAYFAAQPPALRALAEPWFQRIRSCGDEVREILHDGHPTACLGDAAFAYVAVFSAHVNIGFFQGSALPDPAHLLQGAGKFMRHVKLRPASPIDEAALDRLIEAAWLDIKAHVEHG